MYNYRQRVERERAVVITGNVRYITTGEGNERMRELLNTMTLPDGYSFSFGGEDADMAEEFASLFNAMIIAVLTRPLWSPGPTAS